MQRSTATQAKTNTAGSVSSQATHSAVRLAPLTDASACLRGTPGAANMDAVQIVAGQITVAELSAMAEATFGDLVKAVADVRRGLLAVDAGMHSDLEALLLDAGSSQADLWGINLYPAEHGTPGFLEFDSMINLRPGQGNRTRSVEDPAIRAAIAELVGRVVVP